MLAKLAPVDLVLIEGFKRTTSIKIEVYRPSLGKPLIYPADRSVVAVAVDMSVPLPTTIPTLALDDVEAIADFVVLQAMPTEQQLSLSSERMPQLRTRPRVGDGSATRTRLREMQR